MKSPKSWHLIGGLLLLIGIAVAVTVGMRRDARLAANILSEAEMTGNDYCNDVT